MRPINISVAQATKIGNAVTIFIELRDRGYPGATYTLMYHTERDALMGNYHQPLYDQTFGVLFIRTR